MLRISETRLSVLEDLQLDPMMRTLISEIRALRKVYAAAKYWEENSYEYPEQTSFWVSDQKRFLKGQSDTKEAIAAYESGEEI